MSQQVKEGLEHADRELELVAEQMMGEMWEYVGRETFENVPVPDFCEERGYDEDMACIVISYWCWSYMEYGVSPRGAWFHSDPTEDND